MTDIIDMQQPDIPGWRNAEMECEHCEAKWIATFHRIAKALECPKCGGWTPAPSENK